MVAVETLRRGGRRVALGSSLAQEGHERARNCFRIPTMWVYGPTKGAPSSLDAVSGSGIPVDGPIDAGTPGDLPHLPEMAPGPRIDDEEHRFLGR